MKTIELNDRQYEVISSWINDDNALMAVHDLDDVISYIIKQRSGDDNEVLDVLGKINAVRNEISVFIPLQKGGEQ